LRSRTFLSSEDITTHHEEFSCGQRSDLGTTIEQANRCAALWTQKGRIYDI
jgi:hypothetical protein